MSTIYVPAGPTQDERDALSAGRHPKWQRVEAGTVIPAGQPYRIEVEPPFDTKRGTVIAEELVMDKPQPVNGWENNTGTWFVDSSWRPPLVLPTEPTWGIAVTRYGKSLRLGQWDGNGESVWKPSERYGRAGLLDFIPLTDEQVARIEAAR